MGVTPVVLAIIVYVHVHQLTRRNRVGKKRIQFTYANWNLTRIRALSFQWSFAGFFWLEILMKSLLSLCMVIEVCDSYAFNFVSV